MTSISDESGTGVFIQFPLPDQRLFRNQAIEDILQLLLRNLHQQFTVTELRDITGHGGDTIQTAINVLDAAQLIQTRKDGRKKLISANRDRFYNPEDPLLQIPQEQFRDPIKAFVDQVKEDQEDNLVGILLFGSVARGEADRASDIDIQVIVETNLLKARRSIQDTRQEIEETKFNGQRYELQVLVESVETAENYGENLQEIFSEAITFHQTDELEELRQVILNG